MRDHNVLETAFVLAAPSCDSYATINDTTVQCVDSVLGLLVCFG